MSLSKSVRFDGEGFGPQKNHNRKRASSTNDACSRHPYMTRVFWSQARNQFWRSGLYSEESREYLSNHIAV